MGAVRRITGRLNSRSASGADASGGPARMRIVVLVKHVRAAWAFGADGALHRGRPGWLNEADAYAVDQALRIARRGSDVQITAVTMGPAPAAGALRRALTLGADDAVHVLDERLRGCDALATARVLAAAARRL